MSQQVGNEEPRPYLVIPAHKKAISALAYLPDGRLVTGCCNGYVKVWNLEKRGQDGPTIQNEDVLDFGPDLSVTSDGTKIVWSTFETETIKVFDVKSRELIARWTHKGWFATAAISPNGRLIAVAGDTIMAVYTMEGQQVNGTIKIDSSDDNFTRCLSFSPDSSKLARSTRHGEIFVYDVESHKLVLGPIPPPGKGEVNDLVWSCNGGRIFSASDDKTIRCWNSATGAQIGEPWTGHTGYVGPIRLSPDGRILASASFDKTVRFWDATSGDPIGHHLRHDESFRAICFSPFGESMASSCGDDGRIYLWRVPWLVPVERRFAGLHENGLSQIFPISTPDEYVYYALPSPAHNPLSQAGQTIRDPFDDLSMAIQALPHLNSVSTSLPQKEQLQYQTPIFGENIQPPPDLTPYIFKVDDHYVAGGGYGDVYKCWYIDGPPKEVAVKAFRFRFATGGDVSDGTLKMLRRELGIWRRLKHINIVPFLGIAYGFGMRGAVSLVSLWMPNESLHLFLVKYDQKLELGHMLKILLDIANGLRYLHSCPIIHGDLNCNNVLLDADCTARLADFGFASLVGNIPEALAYLQRSTARPGALRWVAPEQVDPQNQFSRTTKSDIYSFGCVALQVLSGKQPWSEIREDSAIVLQLAKGQQPGRPESRAINDFHWSLIQECWSRAEERPTAEAITFAIQLFLKCCPESPPLGDLVTSSLGSVDSLQDLSSLSTYLGTDTMENSTDSDVDGGVQKNLYDDQHSNEAYPEHLYKKQRRTH